MKMMIIYAMAVLLVGFYPGQAGEAVHEHDGEATPAVVDVGHDHDEHEDEAAAQLSPEAMEMAGIELSTVKRAVVRKNLILPGEVGFDEDRLVHITPRFAGIALQVAPRVGDSVRQGDVLAVIESNESLTAYEIKAPMPGQIIRRHVSTGEFVSEESSIFVIADLGHVWVNLAVYPKDAEWIKPGLRAEVSVVGSDLRANGVIEYVTPVLDIETRSITARIVLPNEGGVWRPGTFVRAEVAAGAGIEGLVIDREAVQLLDGETVVFVQEEPGRFIPVEIETGESDAQGVLVRRGLEEGDTYVSHGAFDLKALIVTGSMDPHAGHGH